MKSVLASRRVRTPAAMACKLFAVVGLLLLVAGFIRLEAQTQADRYVIGPRDVLVVTVYDQPSLGGKFTVEADGSFTFPHLGPIKAAGMTVRAVEAQLKDMLGKTLFRNPQVTVGVETYRSQRIFLMGEVRNSGPQQLTGVMTLIEALASAGGATSGAAGHAIIVRPRNGNVEAPTLPGQDSTADVIQVDLKAIQEGNLQQNHILRDGDTVYIPRAETLYVFGEVRSPGTYSVQKDMTVIQAIALAGGQTPNAALNRIKIIRVINGKKVEIKVKDPITELVKAHDTIMVPERWF